MLVHLRKIVELLSCEESEEEGGEVDILLKWVQWTYMYGCHEDAPIAGVGSLCI